MLKITSFLTSLPGLALQLSPAFAETDYYAEHPFGTGTRYAKGADETATGRWFEKTEADFTSIRASEQKRQLAMLNWFKERPRDKAIEPPPTQGR